MGKRIITQRRGRGTQTYKSPSHRYKGPIKYRKYDDKEKTTRIKGVVKDIVHQPGYSAPLAEILFENGEKIYMFAPEGMYTNQVIYSGDKAEPDPGNVLPLRNIPLGKQVFNIESNKGDGGKFIRSSGTSAKIVSKSKNTVTIQFPSKKSKILNQDCRATIGVISGSGRKEKPFVKAGKRYHAMKAKNKLYPQTSGVAMNAVDHPFGSGRGRHIGKPKTPPRNAPPGRNVGLLRAKKTGKKK